jgi:hypothetical protein
MGPDPQQDILDLTFARASTPEEVDAARRRWRACHARVHTASPARPFLVVTPLGLPCRNMIDELLTQQQIAIDRRTLIHDWPSVSTLVYARTDDAERLRVALMFERLWKATTLCRSAERWDVTTRADLIRLIALKPRLQEALGTVEFRVSVPDLAVRSPGRVVHLRAIHVPDLDAFENESRILDELMDRPT